MKIRKFFKRVVFVLVILLFFIYLNSKYVEYSIVSEGLTKEQRKEIISEYSLKGNIDSAREELQKFKRLYPRDAFGYIGSSKIDFHLGDVKSAKKHVLRGLEVIPNSSDLYKQEADLYFKGNFRYTLEMCKVASALDPKSLKKRAILAKMYLFNYNYVEGIKISTDVLKKDPRNYDAYVTLVSCYIDSGNYKMAKKALDKIIGLNLIPKYEDALIELAYQCYFLGEYEYLEKFANEYIFLLGMNKKLVEPLGQAYYIQGRYKKAEEIFTFGIGNTNLEEEEVLDQRTFHAYLGLGLVYLKLNKITEAKGIFERLNYLYPMNNITYYGLGEVYYSEKEYDRAKKYYNYYQEYPFQKVVDTQKSLIEISEVNKIK